MTAAPLDHPILSGLLGDPELAPHLAAEAELAAMLRFERALARSQAALGLLDPAALAAIETACDDFRPDLPALAAATARDGVVVPELLRQLRRTLPAAYHDQLHAGATSQDVIDTGLILRLRPILDVFEQRLRVLIGSLEALGDRFGTNPLMGRTRMQDAMPITVGDRLASWRRPLGDHEARLAALRPRLLVLQFGGPVGTLAEFGERGAALRHRLAAELALGDAPQWHSQRAMLAEFAGWLSLLTGSLGKLGGDILLMGQNAIGEVALAGGGGSSAMPHKENPVPAEVLPALAGFCATLLPGLHHALVHEQERSGRSWTLEWMVMPQMIIAAGAATRTAALLLEQVTWLGAGGGE